MDCGFALSDYAASAIMDCQRSRWVALITLLRTVLDVLEEVDGPAGTPELRRGIHVACRRLFERKPEPRIFHEFIEDERNSVVHQYVLAARVSVRVRMPGHPWMPVVMDPRQGSTSVSHDFEMKDGPYKGQDPRLLCRQAIEFWRDYLDRIDEGS